MSQITYIDVWSVINHSKVNQFYIDSIKCESCTIVADCDAIKKYMDCRSVRIPIRKTDSNLISRIRIFIFICIHLTKASKKIVFLSYDIAFFWVLSYIFQIRKLNVVAFVHNTSPETKFKKLLYRITSKKVKFLTFLPAVKSELLKLGANAYYVPHPLLSGKIEAPSSESEQIRQKMAEKYRFMAFCPSGSGKLKDVETLANLYPTTLFVAKGEDQPMIENILVKSRFEEYNQIMSRCDFVCVPFRPTNKVSGPVYDAVSMNKPVLVLNNEFGLHIKSQFPDHIFFPGEFIPHLVNDINVAQYNQRILETLNEIIN